MIWDQQGSVFWETWRWPWTPASSSDLVVTVDEAENCLYEGADRFVPNAYYVDSTLVWPMCVLNYTNSRRMQDSG